MRQRTAARDGMLQKVLAETPVRVAANVGNEEVEELLRHLGGPRFA